MSANNQISTSSQVSQLLDRKSFEDMMGTIGLYDAYVTKVETPDGASSSTWLTVQDETGATIFNTELADSGAQVGELVLTDLGAMDEASLGLVVPVLESSSYRLEVYRFDASANTLSSLGTKEFDYRPETAEEINYFAHVRSDGSAEILFVDAASQELISWDSETNGSVNVFENVSGTFPETLLTSVGTAADVFRYEFGDPALEDFKEVFITKSFDGSVHLAIRDIQSETEIVSQSFTDVPQRVSVFADNNDFYALIPTSLTWLASDDPSAGDIYEVNATLYRFDSTTNGLVEEQSIGYTYNDWSSISDPLLSQAPDGSINIDYVALNGDLVRWNTVDEVASMLLSGVGTAADVFRYEFGDPALEDFKEVFITKSFDGSVHLAIRDIQSETEIVSQSFTDVPQRVSVFADNNDFYALIPTSLTWLASDDPSAGDIYEVNATLYRFDSTTNGLVEEQSIGYTYNDWSSISDPLLSQAPDGSINIDYVALNGDLVRWNTVDDMAEASLANPDLESIEVRFDQSDRQFVSLDLHGSPSGRVVIDDFDLSDDILDFARGAIMHDQIIMTESTIDDEAGTLVNFDFDGDGVIQADESNHAELFLAGISVDQAEAYLADINNFGTLFYQFPSAATVSDNLVLSYYYDHLILPSY